MIHPLTVHFPIVLAFVWPLLDLAGLLLKKPDLSKAALVVLILAAIAAFVSVVTGTSSFDAAVEAKIDPALLNTHADDANLVPWVMLLLVAARTVGALKLGKKGHAGAIALGVLSWVLMFSVGRSGGALVFEHGIGVGAGSVGTVEQRDANR